MLLPGTCAPIIEGPLTNRFYYFRSESPGWTFRDERINFCVGPEDFTIFGDHDWQSRLSAYLASRRGMAFAWGSNDCATFAAGAIEAMTGEDLRASFGNYTTEAGAVRALRRAGFDGVGGVADRYFTRVTAGRAMPGDLCLVPGDDGGALAVVGSGVAYVVTPHFVGLVPLTAASVFWKV